ncbi:MAG: hypothetical protein ACRECH_13740 [Nitrososphaerales archaeon]
MDRLINAETRYPRGLKDYSKWANDPAHSDILKIDTIPRKMHVPQRVEVQKKALPEQRPEIITRKQFERNQAHITPFVKREYDIWHDQYLKEKQEGRKRKSLTELGLQKYFDSRKAAFEVEGGTPDSFKDAFDKIDVAIAADSWHDLDSELKRENIYGPDVSETTRRAKEEAAEDRRISKEYEGYLKSEGEGDRHAAAG